jgi:hypothetical protein
MIYGFFSHWSKILILAVNGLEHTLKGEQEFLDVVSMALFLNFANLFTAKAMSDIVYNRYIMELMNDSYSMFYDSCNFLDSFTVFDCPLL